jgi:hypothetical protein
MKNFMKNMDLGQIQDRVSDLKNQLDDIRFRKPWTTSRSSSSLMLLALGAGLAAVGIVLYKKRAQVAKLCNNCGLGFGDRLNGVASPESLRESVSHD